MTLGMTYDQYWNDDPDIMVAYATLYSKQSKSNFAEQDTLAWMIGSYVDAAVTHVMSAAFGGRGAPKSKYPSQPQYITEIDENAKAKKQERELAKFENNFLIAVHNMGKTIEETVQ